MPCVGLQWVPHLGVRISQRRRAAAWSAGRLAQESAELPPEEEKFVVSSRLGSVPLLPGENDEHGGVIVVLKDPMDSTAFHASLQASITNWRKQGIKGVWIKLSLKLANLVEAAVKEGFWYHHAEPDYLMLVHWLPDTMHTIPVNATHRVGIGAFVMNDKREVLVVQEKYSPHRRTALWKFPTGVVEQGEDLHAGAIREVKKETGIDSEFIEVLAFRQSHMAYFGKSDLFFVCMLSPLSHNIHPQESEIEAAKWMPLEEYAAQPLIQQHELLKYTLDVCLAKIDKTYSGFSQVCAGSLFSPRRGWLYLNSRDSNKASESGNQIREGEVEGELFSSLPLKSPLVHQ